MPSRSVGLLVLALGVLVLRVLRGRAPASAQAQRPAKPHAPASFPWRLSLGLVIVAAFAVAGTLAWRGLETKAKTLAVARAITRGEPDRAPDLLIRYGCGGCHAVPGVAGATGKVAAPLVGMRERVYVGGVARNTADNMIRWIVAPQSLSPHSAMPATGITEAEARDVAAYLYSR